MLDKYLNLSKKNLLPNLDGIEKKEFYNIEELKREVQLVHTRTTNMYQTSTIMRKIQYAFDKNIIRIWNDHLSEMNDRSLIVKELEKLE